MIRRALALAVLLSAPPAAAWAADAGAANDQSGAAAQPQARNPEYLPSPDQVKALLPDFARNDPKMYFADEMGNPTTDMSKAVSACNDDQRICYNANVGDLIDKAYKSNEKLSGNAALHEAASTTGGTVCDNGVLVSGMGPCPPGDQEEQKGSKDDSKKCGTEGCAPLSDETVKEEGLTPDCPKCIKGEDEEIDFDAPDAEDRLKDKILKSDPDEEEDGPGGFGIMGTDKTDRAGSDGGQNKWSANPTDGGTSGNPQGQKMNLRNAPGDALAQYTKSVLDMIRGSKNADAATSVSEDQRTFMAAKRITERGSGTAALRQLDTAAEHSKRGASLPSGVDSGTESLDDRVAAEQDRPFSNSAIYDPVRVQWVNPKSRTEGEETDRGTHNNAFGSAAVVPVR
ncbi:MAG TPA: hypothetical protein DCM05_11335 [Elusimicrobia bacterium]|nr:hypothetical protein [Elusimicrobiota bacterium]